ncbi:sterol 24-C-methyltransferase [Crepidotus variabilis]|uniref:Sterol 24-C-methyltransferase n=1 Tax=Crepidotus variabilis TaxID=179855 RepID=A0A9P6JJJ1_9AGAR|nr:sterol 24-C-methyltransferase [Crepidotus variabilis]
MSSQSVDFHFARLHRGDKFEMALSRHKHYLFGKLGLKPGMRVLEVGCRSGKAALELFRFAGVNVVGIDNDLVKAWNLEQLSAYFSTASFDAVFSIEALRDLPSLESTFGQLHSLLRPGGKLAVYEWCWTEALDPLNYDHQRLVEALQTAAVIGHRQVLQRSLKAATHALELAHFQAEECVDRSLTSSTSNIIEWYAPLETALGNSQVKWASAEQPSRLFGGITKEAATALVYAGRYGLFTPMAMLVGKRSNLISYTMIQNRIR